MSGRGAYMGGRYGPGNGGGGSMRGPGDMPNRGPYMGSGRGVGVGSGPYVSGMNPPPMGMAGGIAYYYARPPMFYAPGPYPNMGMPPTPQVTLLAAIGRQVEYYFSQENLVRDVFLRSKMDSSGWIELGVIAAFNRLRMLTQDPNHIIEALKDSHVIEFAPDNTKLRKRVDWQSWVLTDASSSSSTVSSLSTAPAASVASGAAAPPAARQTSRLGREQQQQKATHDSVFVMDEEEVVPSDENSGLPSVSEENISDADADKLVLIISADRNVQQNGSIMDPELARLINEGLESYQDQVEKERQKNRDSKVYGEHFYPGSLHDSGFEGRKDAGESRANGPSSGLGWILAHTPDKDGRSSKATQTPSKREELTTPLPELEHPGMTALDSKGFKQVSYKKLFQQCTDERQRMNKDKMHDLFRFWSFFLRTNFNRKMYNAFCAYALEDSKKGDHYGAECLFRYYSYGLENRFRHDLFDDFQENAVVVSGYGSQYGADKLRAFYEHFPKASALTLKSAAASLIQNGKKKER